MRRALAPLVLSAACLAFAATATAATLEVENHNETGPGSLGETILQAGPGDTILLGPGEYPLTEGATLTAQGNVLQGAGTERTTIVPTGGGEALNSSNVVDASIAPPRQPQEGDGGSKIDTKAQILALIVTVAIFLLILDLVRRRRLVERYALLWLSSAAALVVLAIWTDGLDVIADAIGIEEPANAIFILSFGIVFLLLLNFSVATSRLSEETKILAQEAARIEQELRELRGESPGANGAGSAGAEPEQREHDRPVGG